MDRACFYEKLAAVSHNPHEVFSELRRLPIDAVADILNHIPPEYESLRRILPAMASDDVQISWTGSSGYPLLMQSCAFVRALEGGYRRFTERGLDGLRILDYGCGWGRLIRLMYKFTDPSNIYGCDPWDRSIELCRECNLPGTFAISDYLPTKLPFADIKFNLIYSFSVFTHLSERASQAALRACRQAIRDDGLLAITVRPFSYWDYHDEAQNKVDREAMKSEHRLHGFAFTPHNRAPIDGDITYGDASISLPYMQENWPEWEVLGTDVFLQDPFQTLVFLRPR
ncbi:Methyltransferase domain-containing protein [Paraburkholderia steynii]|uniref:Methyltransferase domain-containing protein n=1 Tax=Paraburkholderia steynii TaxID=1245441 RepID=A0A7Z7B836_9BURK|nr:class I SAM-dependent methyltransferase [Paraburkholderia steynii]SDI07246.1 Methyltransferase domain-containing protein [Paraburkholderia steynii]